MNRIKRLLVAGIMGLSLSTVGVLLPARGYALFESAKDQACNGANLQDTGGCETAGAKEDQVSTILKTVLQILSLVVGVISVIMVIIGGIRFVTSQGDGGSTAAARNTIIYALVGLVIASIAQVLVIFVLNKAYNPGTNQSEVPDKCITINPCRK